MFRAETRCFAGKLQKGRNSLRAETPCLASKLKKGGTYVPSRNYSPLALSSTTRISICGVARTKARALSRYYHGDLVLI